MNDACRLRVLLSAGLTLAASFASPHLLAADGAPESSAGPSAGAPQEHAAAVLDRYARDAHDSRVSSAWWTMGGGAALVASGLISASGDHQSWGHFVWISGGVSLLSGLVQLLVPSALEQLENESGGRTPGYTPATLAAAWKVQAAEARTRRQVSGITGLSTGAASLSAGSLLAAGVGDLNHGDRVGWSVGCFVAGGVLTLDGIITLLVPSRTEEGYATAFPTSSVSMDVGVAPAPGGGTLQLSGSF